jgi:hypothetical protein
VELTPHLLYVGAEATLTANPIEIWVPRLSSGLLPVSVQYARVWSFAYMDEYDASRVTIPLTHESLVSTGYGPVPRRPARAYPV